MSRIKLASLHLAMSPDINFSLGRTYQYNETHVVAEEYDPLPLLMLQS